MQQFDISLPAGFVIPTNNGQLIAGLNLFLSPNGIAEPGMADAIQYENKPKFGPSAISNIRFDVMRYDPVNLTGRLRLLYNMQLTFGCEDFVKDHPDQHSYYNFRFISEHSLLHFESDALGAPSTADEF
jgi:hypothetical protein